MTIDVRIAQAGETSVVSDILVEAATWLEQRGTPMWPIDELRSDSIAADVGDGRIALAWCEGAAAGTVRFQLEDPLFWPDGAAGDAVYVHRLAVRRRYAGGEVSSALLTWAACRCRALGRQILRLDCEASRDRLRAVYERFGFTYHSDRLVGPYAVARYEYRLDAHVI